MLETQTGRDPVFHRTLDLTDPAIAKACTSKHRWPDELTARAGAAFSIETIGNVEKLYTYKCPYCRGHHLTRQPQKGQEPIVIGENHGNDRA